MIWMSYLKLKFRQILFRFQAWRKVDKNVVIQRVDVVVVVGNVTNRCFEVKIVIRCCDCVVGLAKEEAVVNVRDVRDDDLR